MRLTVAKIVRAQGLRGEVAIAVHTDDPAVRFAPGTVLETEPASAGPLTVVKARTHHGRWMVAFEGVSSREAAEALRGVELVIDAANSEEPDAWYSHELVGLTVELTTGEAVGVVVGLENAPAQDLLMIKETNGARTAVPFVSAIVPIVDVAGGRVVIDPPGGLLAADSENLDVVLPEPTDHDGSAGSDDARDEQL